MKVSVAFTARNEADLILTTLSESVRDMDLQGNPYELIVVDNCSTDATAQLAEEFAVTHPQVRVIRHEQDRGYAHSNLTAYKNATGDIVALLDSDGQQTVRDIPKAIAKINAGSDVVFGWRKERHDPIVRKLISAGLSVVARVRLRYPFHDINTGFRVVTSKVDKIVEDVVPVNYFGAELWVRAVQNGWKCDEIVVEHFARMGGQSIFVPWKMPITMKKAYDYISLLQKQLPPRTS